MEKIRKISWFTLLVIMLASIVGLSLAQENPDAGAAGRLQRAEARTAVLSSAAKAMAVAPQLAGKTGEFEFNREHVYIGDPTQFPSAAPDTVEDTCYQLLANPQLDIVEFGDGSGTAEPWTILDQIVYYDDQIYTSPNYSLVLIDGDGGDPSPGGDAFAQGFIMPDNLTGVRIDYFSGTLETNSTDRAFGNIWTLDQDGYLDQPLFNWEVIESDNQWLPQYLLFTGSSELQLLQGKILAILLFNVGNNSAPGEETFFDDITVIACVKDAPPSSGTVYLPTILNKYGVAPDPVCSPPTENPQDQYNANRGHVETGATCNSNLSNLDRADYYAYTPTKSGNHTLRLTNLPTGTEWSAMMFTDTANPQYVPGPTNGDCRIGTPGDVNKQVTCNLQKNVPLIVKVSAGSTPVPGSYTMRITGP